MQLAISSYAIKILRLQTNADQLDVSSVASFILAVIKAV